MPRIAKEHATVFAQFFKDTRLEPLAGTIHAVDAPSSTTPLTETRFKSDREYFSAWSDHESAGHGTVAVRLRGPLPLVSSRDCLAALLKVDDVDLWQSEVITAALGPIWRDHIYPLHVRDCIIFGVQVVAFTIMAVCLANGIDPSLSHVRALDLVILLSSAHFIRLEWLQHRRQGIGFSNGFFDLCDTPSAFLAAGCAIAHATGQADRTALLVSSAIAALFLLVKAVALLRGFEAFRPRVVLVQTSASRCSSWRCCTSTLIFLLLFADARDDDFEDDDQAVGLRRCPRRARRLLRPPSSVRRRSSQPAPARSV